jgi:hypothetical protein
MVAPLDRSNGSPKMTFQQQDPAHLEAISRLAIELVEMGKAGTLPLVPYVRLNSAGYNLQNTGDYDTFRQQNIVITDIALDADGIYTQRMVTEAVDHLGRRDIRDDRVVFTLRDANQEEASAIAETILLNTSKTFDTKGLSKQQRDVYQKVIAEYQKMNGLKPDGIFGMNTAKSLATKIPIIDIRKMSSAVVYPANPRNAVYVVPSATVRERADKFYKGFESLETVRQHALSPEEFGKSVQKGAEFVIFAYFFDRVDPVKPVTIRISEYKSKATGTTGPKWYAVPGKWPVVVETFCLAKVPTFSSSQLYANVFIKNKYTSRCIGTHKIK